MFHVFHRVLHAKLPVFVNHVFLSIFYMMVNLALKRALQEHYLKSISVSLVHNNVQLVNKPLQSVLLAQAHSSIT